MLCQAEYLDASGPYRVIDDPTQGPNFVKIVQLVDIHDGAVVLESARHSARSDLETGGVCYDRLLEADLRAVGKGSNHCRVLPPPFCPSLLGSRVAIGVLQALDVSHDARDETQTLYPAVKVHLQARFVALASRQDDLVLARIHLENRTDRGVDLGIHQHDGLAVLEGLENYVSAELDRARDVDDDVDLAGAAHHEGVFGHGRLALANRLIELSLRACHDDGLEPRVAKHVLGTLRTPIGDGSHAHARNTVSDLIGEPLPHETGADHAHANRFSLLLSGFQSIVDDDHGFLRPDCILRTQFNTLNTSESHALFPRALILRFNSGSILRRSGHSASLGDISTTGSGRTSPSRESL